MFFLNSLNNNTHSLMIDKQQDSIIWDAFKNGNKNAFEHIYREHYSSLKHYALKFSLDNSIINDLIHELFIELIESTNKISTTTNIRYYLLGAIRNKIYSLHSKGKKERIGECNELNFDFSESIEEQLIKNETKEKQRKVLLVALDKLTHKQQEIIYLRFHNNLSYKEIALLFATKPQTVQNLMSRAISTLRTEIEKSDIGENIFLLLMKVLPEWTISKRFSN